VTEATTDPLLGPLGRPGTEVTRIAGDVRGSLKVPGTGAANPSSDRQRDPRAPVRCPPPSKMVANS
jgi:hypothetical protein